MYGLAPAATGSTVFDRTTARRRRRPRGSTAARARGAATRTAALDGATKPLPRRRRANRSERRRLLQVPQRQDHPTLRHRRAQAESWRVMGLRTCGIVGLTRRRPVGKTVATPRIGGGPSRAVSVGCPCRNGLGRAGSALSGIFGAPTVRAGATRSLRPAARPSRGVGRRGATVCGAAQARRHRPRPRRAVAPRRRTAAARREPSRRFAAGCRAAAIAIKVTPETNRRPPRPHRRARCPRRRQARP